MKIQVIATPTSEHITDDGKDYNKLVVTYKNLQSGKVEVKSIMDFAAPEVFKRLKTAAANDTFDVTMVKNGKYWNWTEVARDDGKHPEAGTMFANGSAPAPATKGGTWEAKNALDAEKFEFEKKKQPLIVRQSSAANAIEYYKMTGVAPTDLHQLLETAEHIYLWVMQEGAAGLNSDVPY